jgi:hypothetical protein
MTLSRHPDTTAPPGALASLRHGAAGAGLIRAFREEDAAAVAMLCQRVFHHTDEPPPAGLAACFVETFLGHPGFDPELASQVYVAPDGALRGFVGVLPLRMVFAGQKLRAAVAASVMVDGAASDPLAGARLLRSFFGGPQDLSLGDNVNEPTRRMLQPLRVVTDASSSLEWMRILRPAGFVAALAARRAGMLRALHAPAGLLDAALIRRAGRFAPPPPSGAPGREVAPEALAEAIPGLIGNFTLRPDFDTATLSWLLAQAARKAERGEPVARLVLRADGRLAGAWLGHLAPRGVLRVLQVFAPPAESSTMVADILGEAWRRGAVAASGRLQAELAVALQLAGCLFRHGGFTLIRTRQTGLAEAVARGDAVLNGIAGETWTRLNGDRLG